MGAHAESVGDGLEIFLLLVDAVAAAPPPRLVNERSVRGIHEADDAVIDADGHVGGEIGEFVHAAGLFPELLPELLNLWCGLRSAVGLGESRALRAGLGNIDPDEAVLFLAGITAGVDAIHFQILIGGERRDELALAGVGVECPAVVGALDVGSVKVAVVERHAAVRAGVAQREGTTLAIAPNDQRNFKERGLMKLVAHDAIGGQGAIPEAREHERIGRLALRKIEFGHGAENC